MARKKPSEINAEALSNLLKNHNSFDRHKIKNIISLVGVSGTGKTHTLNKLIDDLTHDKKHWTCEFILKGENFSSNPQSEPKLIGDLEDTVAILKSNLTQQRVGIFTSGDYTDIVSNGISYLLNKNCTTFVLASHPITFRLFISQLHPVSIGVLTHYIDNTDLQQKMYQQNSNAIKSIMNTLA
ncbi:hypothetical protein ACT5YT_11030 [Leuconostoc suionicum]|uniref:hypothetical protein n=1 Tax=Leuconostoc suionicum TaxID=1511761 RepID=UPI0040362ED6